MNRFDVPHFTPSSTMLLDMIRRAEAKCDADIKRMREEHFERAVAINARKIREEREHNQRRYVYAGDRP
jgi:hypothetical protein